jgi:excisionase family DNA binding protein
MKNILISEEQYDKLLSRVEEIDAAVASMLMRSEDKGNYFTNAELMKLLGVSKRTVQRWRMSGRLPFIKFEKKLLYRADAILNCFSFHPSSPDERGHSPPSDDISPDIACVRCPLFLFLNGDEL